MKVVNAIQTGILLMTAKRNVTQTCIAKGILIILITIVAIFTLFQVVQLVQVALKLTKEWMVNYFKFKEQTNLVATSGNKVQSF